VNIFIVGLVPAIQMKSGLDPRNESEGDGQIGECRSKEAPARWPGQQDQRGMAGKFCRAREGGRLLRQENWRSELQEHRFPPTREWQRL